jgi:hypothetical protein
VNLVQADNLSWFGYPEDPVPSVRATLLPGITQASPLMSCAGPAGPPRADVSNIIL